MTPNADLELTYESLSFVNGECVDNGDVKPIY